MLATLQKDHAAVLAVIGQYAALSPMSESLADRKGLIARVGALLRALYKVNEEILSPLLDQFVDAALLERARGDQKLLGEQLRRVAAEDAALSVIDEQMDALTGLVQADLAMEAATLLPQLEGVDNAELTQIVASHGLEMLGEQGPDGIFSGDEKFPAKSANHGSKQDQRLRYRADQPEGKSSHSDRCKNSASEQNP